MQNKWLAISLIILGMQAWAAEDIQEALGAFNNAGARSVTGLTEGVARENVPSFKGTPEYDANDAYGKGGVFPTDQGNSRLAECQAQGASGEETTADCAASNFVTGKVYQEPLVDIPGNDAIVSGKRTHDIQNNPSQITTKAGLPLPVRGADGRLNSDALAGACGAEITQTRPASFVNESCIVYRGTAAHSCTQNLVVTVDPHFMYSCLTAGKHLATPTCQRTLTVQAQYNCNEGDRMYSEKGTGDYPLCSSFYANTQCQYVRADGGFNFNFNAGMADQGGYATCAHGGGVNIMPVAENVKDLTARVDEKLPAAPAADALLTGGTGVNWKMTGTQKGELMWYGNDINMRPSPTDATGYWHWIYSLGQWGHYLGQMQAKWPMSKEVVDKPAWPGAPIIKHTEWVLEAKEFSVFVLARSAGCTEESCSYEFAYETSALKQLYIGGPGGPASVVATLQSWTTKTNNIKPLLLLTEKWSDNCQTLEAARIAGAKP